MKIIPNWREVLKWAWSIRLAALAAVLSGVEIALPFFAESFPAGIFAGLSFLATVGAFIARFVAQQGITK